MRPHGLTWKLATATSRYRQSIKRHQVAGMLVLAFVGSPVAYGDDKGQQPRTLSVQVSAGMLTAALMDFAAQAGIHLSFDAETLRGLTSAGLSGSVTIEEGLRRLLAGRPVMARQLAGNAYVVESVPASRPANGAAAVAPPVAQLAAVPVITRTASTVMASTRSVTTLDREELESLDPNAESLASALAKAIPGMADSSRTMTDYGQTLRGRNMLIMLDGVPLNTNRDTSRNLVNIPAGDIEQVDVLRGSSAVYGSGGAGGIVAVRTRHFDGTPRAETTVGATGALSRPGAAGLGGDVRHFMANGNDTFDYTLSLGQRRIPGAFDARGRRIAPEPSQGDLFDGNASNIATKLGWNIDPRQRLQLSASHYIAAQDTDYATDPSVGRQPAGSVSARPIKGLRLDKQNRVSNTMAGLDYLHRDAWGSRVEAQVYYRDFFTRFSPFDARAVVARGQFVDQIVQNSRVAGGRLTVTTPIGNSGKTQVVWGSDVTQERSDMPLDTFDAAAYDASQGLRFERTGTRIFMPPITTGGIGAFAQVRHRFSPRWSAEGGARYDRASARFDDFTPLSQTRVASPGRVQGGKVNYNATTYNLGIVFAPVPRHEFHASFTQGFELPDIGLQVRNATPSFRIGSSDLKPVLTDTVEAGWRGRFNNARSTLTVFQSRSDLGAVQSSFNGLIMTRTKERITGIEGTLDSYSDDGRWNVGGALSWMKGRELPQGGQGYQDMWGYRIPPLKATAHVEYRPDARWTHRLQLTAFSGRDYRLNGSASFGRRDVTGYVTLDALTRIAIDRNNQVSIGIENLLNRQYYPAYSQLLRSGSNTSRLPAPGTVVKISYTHRW